MILYRKEIDSTNLEAARLADTLPHGAVIMAEIQTAGKGRRGRSWVSNSGENLYFSMLLKPDFCPDKAPMLTLVMALAAAEAIESEYPDSKPQIKWPNDIVLNGKKICGILTEMQLEGSKIKHVIIGVGINVNQMEFSDENLTYATSLCKETSVKKDKRQLLEAVIRHFEQWYAVFEKEGNLQSFIEPYQERLTNLGKEVRVLDPKGAYQGTALGIDPYGELIVCKEDGSQIKVYAGEVSVRGLYGYV